MNEENAMNAKEKKDLLMSKIALLAVACVALLIIVWLAWMRPSGSSRKQVSSYSECVAAGYPVLVSYPEVCVAGDGQRFVNPSQH